MGLSHQTYWDNFKSTCRGWNCSAGCFCQQKATKVLWTFGYPQNLSLTHYRLEIKSHCFVELEVIWTGGWISAAHGQPGCGGDGSRVSWQPAQDGNTSHIAGCGPTPKEDEAGGHARVDSGQLQFLASGGQLPVLSTLTFRKSVG